MTTHRCKWEIHRNDAGQYWVRFVAGNGNVIVSSETYKRKRDAIHAIRIVGGHLAAFTEIRDLTKVRP